MFEFWRYLRHVALKNEGVGESPAIALHVLHALDRRDDGLTAHRAVGAAGPRSRLPVQRLLERSQNPAGVALVGPASSEFAPGLDHHVLETELLEHPDRPLVGLFHAGGTGETGADHFSEVPSHRFDLGAFEALFSDLPHDLEIDGFSSDLRGRRAGLNEKHRDHEGHDRMLTWEPHGCPLLQVGWQEAG